MTLAMGILMTVTFVITGRADDNAGVAWIVWHFAASSEPHQQSRGDYPVAKAVHFGADVLGFPFCQPKCLDRRIFTKFSGALDVI